MIWKKIEVHTKIESNFIYIVKILERENRTFLRDTNRSTAHTDSQTVCTSVDKDFRLSPGYD